MLKTSRLNLRPFTSEDLDLLFQLHANPEVAKTTIDGVQSHEQVKKHLDSFIAHQEKFGFSQFAVFENESEKFVGRAGLTKRALSQEIGEYVELRFAFLPEFWGWGYASEVVADLIEFGLKNLQLKELSAACGTNNDKSIRILTKHGFRFIKNFIPQGYGTEGETKFFLLEL